MVNGAGSGRDISAHHPAAIAAPDATGRWKALSEVEALLAAAMFADYDPTEALGDPLAVAIRDYWAAKTAEDEREAYARILAHGGVPSYGESEDEVDRLIARYGLRREPDVLAITRAVSRGD